MCGIIGYIGTRDATPLLIEGLRRLEYRGYDSAGIAYLSEGRLKIQRAVGKLSSLEAVLSRDLSPSHLGIGHTRWATHGKPTEENAHPHRAGAIALIHNGIIENYRVLRDTLVASGRDFSSETDTEVIAHLIDRRYQTGVSFKQAVSETLTQIEGSFALCIICEDEPQQMIAVRRGSPLTIGMGSKEFFVASDVQAFVAQTSEAIFLDDGEMAHFSDNGVCFYDAEGRSQSKQATTLSHDQSFTGKGTFRHFMQKEIHEQSRAIMDTLFGRVSQQAEAVCPDDLIQAAPSLGKVDLARSRRILLVGCGTSWHSALIGKFFFEAIAGIPTEVDIASEFRYRNPPLSKGDLLIATSQSGETADTLAALREAQIKGVQTLAICNVVGSTLSREAGRVLYTRAGPEIAVASTKAFTTQLVAFFLLACFFGQTRKTLPVKLRKQLVRELLAIPHKIDILMAQEQAVATIAKQYFRCRDFLFLGRNLHYPVALEGALKLKEVSYIHAEGYPAGEMKHGPIALIDEHMPVVVIVPRDHVREKVISNIMEVKARDGKIIAVTHGDDAEAAALADAVISTPEVSPYLSPILTVIPLQMLAYHVALLRGSDIDQPRNLAKSVTVE